jgi:hypothetical protein
MLSLLLTALYRYSMLEKLLKTQRGLFLVAWTKSWYARAPRKVQLTAAAGVLVLLGLVLFS